MSILLTIPMMAFAAQPANATVKAVSSSNAIYTGYINENNVNLRNSSGISLGQVNYGDTLTINLATSGKYFNGIFYRLVTMTSGQNNGRSGWVSADYISIYI
jgi:FlaG/FlaF family flagellin (archaellin)